MAVGMQLLAPKAQVLVQALVLRQFGGGGDHTVVPRSYALIQELYGPEDDARATRLGYGSVTDMMICAFLPEEKAGCMAYYRGKGTNLLGLKGAKGCKELDLVLEEKLLAVKAQREDEARRAASRGQRQTLRQEVRQEVRQAGIPDMRPTLSQAQWLMQVFSVDRYNGYGRAYDSDKQRVHLPSETADFLLAAEILAEWGIELDDCNCQRRAS